MCKSLRWGCENSDTGKVLRKADIQPNLRDGLSDNFKVIVSKTFSEEILLQKVSELLNWEKAWKKDLFCQDIAGKKEFGFQTLPFLFCLTLSFICFSSYGI